MTIFPHHPTEIPGSEQREIEGRGEGLPKTQPDAAPSAGVRFLSETHQLHHP